MFRKIFGKFATFLRKKRLMELQEQFGFDDWHLYSVTSKPYVREIVDYIFHNSSPDEKGCLLECGCGLCDIIGNSNLKRYQRVGIDISEEVCNAAQALHENIELINGSFDIIKGRDIRFLIAVNFVHEISSDEMRKILQMLAEDNEIQGIIVDEVTGHYPYTHNFDKIMPSNYCCIKTMGPYGSDGGKRYVKVFEKRI